MPMAAGARNDIRLIGPTAKISGGPARPDAVPNGCPPRGENTEYPIGASSSMKRKSWGGKESLVRD